MKPIKKAIETIQTLGTENKRLKDELELLSDDYDVQCQCRDGYRMDNVRLREALYDISIACQEDFPDDEIVTDVFRIARETLDDNGGRNGN